MLAGILPGAVYVLVTWQTTTGALSESIGLSFKETARRAAREVAERVTHEITAADILAHDPQVLAALKNPSGSPVEPNDSLAGHRYFLTSQSAKYTRFVVANKKGEVIVAGPRKTFRDLKRFPWWGRIGADGGPRAFVGNLRRDPGSRKDVLDVAIAVFDERGRRAGVFALELTLEGLLRGIETVDNKSSHLDVFDAGGNLLIDENTVAPRKVRPGLLNKLAQSKPVWRVARDEHGILSLIGVAPITFGPDFASDLFSAERRWNVMITQGLISAYSPIINLMLKLFVLGWGAMAIMFVIGYYRAGRIVDPLRKLAVGARQIGTGNLDFQVDVRTNDEIGQVAEEFNRMTVALKASQQHLKAANAQLEYANKLKSEFLANMSHELRTPLNSIIGFAEVMADELFGTLNGKQKKYVDNIHTSGHHLLQLINDILDLSKIEAGRAEMNYVEFSAEKCLKETYTGIKSMAEKKSQRLELKVDPNLVTIAADEGKFRQIMYNLLSNAVKFSPPGGRILVEAINQRGLAVISVTDMGIGISKKDQEMIFEQFRQVNGADSREFGGTGLGLALTRKLVELHGGRIWVESDLGKGSKFTFSLPVQMPDHLVGRDEEEVTRVCRLDARTTAPPVPVLTAKAPAKAKKPTILVVDDDPKAIELITIYLKEADYEVVTAGSAEEAVPLAQEEQPLAITLDIMLPGKGGWELLEQLKASPLTRDIPVIICSMVDDKQQGISLGAAGHLTKPIKKADLVNSITKCRQAFAKDRPYVVLVVDDDPSQVELLTSILEPEGFGVIQAFGGEEAVDKAVRLKPDLMILDLMMPKYGGFDVIHGLNSLEGGSDLPIIVLTAKELTTKDRQFLNRNIERVVQKTKFRKDDLIREIRKLEQLDPHKAMLVDLETGLFNYRFFRKRLVEESVRAQRYRRAFAVMLIEIRNLNQIKSPSDGENGLSVLKDVAWLLEQNVRGADPVARYTETQFAVILPETTKTGALKAAEKIAHLLQDYQALDKTTAEPAALAVGIGVGAFFEDAEDGQALIDMVEARLDKGTLTVPASGNPTQGG